MDAELNYALAVADALRESATFKSDQFMSEEMRERYGSIRLAGERVIRAQAKKIETLTEDHEYALDIIRQETTAKARVNQLEAALATARQEEREAIWLLDEVIRWRRYQQGQTHVLYITDIAWDAWKLRAAPLLLAYRARSTPTPTGSPGVDRPGGTADASTEERT